MHSLKFFVFRHQWWILVLAATCSVSALFVMGQPLPAYLTVLAVLGSVFYFLQRQNLEEMALFRDLFKEFNLRYDTMNGPLSELLSKPEAPLSQGDQKLVVDYFNLCGEEYFYFSRGFVDPRVWKAWSNGMRQYLKDPRIQALWKEESKSNSYYGLSI